MSEPAVEFLHFVPAVRGSRQSDTPIRMEVINVLEWQKSVQWRIDRGRNRVLPESTERIHLDHLVFRLHAAIPACKGMQLLEIEGGEAAPLNASDISAAAFDPQHFLV